MTFQPGVGGRPGSCVSALGLESYGSSGFRGFLGEPWVLGVSFMLGCGFRVLLFLTRLFGVVFEGCQIQPLQTLNPKLRIPTDPKTLNPKLRIPSDHKP